MKFVRIELLFLIWIIPLLVLTYLYGWRKRRHILNEYAVQRTLAHLVPKGMVRRRRVVAILALTAVGCAVMSMSGPQYGFQWQEIERQGIDIIIAMDCSRSMLATDIRPTRLDRAKREIVDLLNMLQGDRVGLVAFSGTAFLQCPLTIDYPAFYLFLDVLTPDYLPVGGSDLTTALQIAREAFDPQSSADKAVILITDGEHTGKGDPMEAARAALKSGIKLFTIGVGSGDGVPVPEKQGGFKKDASGQIVLSRLDESLLSRMALATGGSYVRSVAGDIDLETIYVEQVRARMEGATVKSGRKQIWVDRYQWPLVLAVLLLLLTRWVPGSSQAVILALAVAGILSASSSAEADPLKDGYDAYQKEAYDKALKQFSNGQLHNPENPSLLYNLGNTYYKLRNFEAAEAHFHQALPKAPSELKPHLLYNLGNSAYRRGQLEEAVEHYESALQFDPDDPQTRENLAFVKQQLQKQQQKNSSDKNQQSDNKDAPQQNQNPEDPSSQSRERSQQKERPSTGDGPESQPEQPPTPDPSAEQPQKSDPKRPPQETSGDEDRDAEQKAASQMLHRLKDQPGRAMMPDYQKRSVEKDW